MSNIDYDILVVGAGPAGAVFAQGVAGSGLRILMIDGQTAGHTKPCGGLLAPDAQKALAQLGLTLPRRILVDPQIFSVKTIDVTSGCVRYYPRHYLNMNRLAFDQWLVSRVPSCVERLYGRCTAVQRIDGGFAVTIRAQGKTSLYRTRMVVGADGASSVVRRCLYSSRIPQYVAIQQWFDTQESTDPFYSCIFDSQTSDSCSWSICKDGALVFGGTFAPNKCREQFERQKQRLEGRFGFHFGQPLKTEACLVNCPHRLGDFVTGREGAYLIGEAAGFISPSSFEGISSALLSGQALAQAFRQAEKPAHIARLYAHAARRLKAKLLLKSIKRGMLYHAFPRQLIMKSGLTAIRPVASLPWPTQDASLASR